MVSYIGENVSVEILSSIMNDDDREMKFERTRGAGGKKCASDAFSEVFVSFDLFLSRENSIGERAREAND